MLQSVASLVIPFSSRSRCSLMVVASARHLPLSTSFFSTFTLGASSSTSSLPSSEITDSNNLLLCGSTEHSLGKIIRHGRGDACITLNVGGTEFLTLRSTVAANPVLADHVHRTEANRELVTITQQPHSGAGAGNRAVFVDRDPKHFGFILQYLRNQVEWETSKNLAAAGSGTSNNRFLMASWKTKSYMPQLPKDSAILAELYVEATYYRIEELQVALRDQSFWTRFVRLLGLSKVGGFYGNPFVRTSQLLGLARMALVTVTSVLAGAMTMATTTSSEPIKQQIRKMLEYFQLLQASLPHAEEEGEGDSDKSGDNLAHDHDAEAPDSSPSLT